MVGRLEWWLTIVLTFILSTWAEISIAYRTIGQKESLASDLSFCGIFFLAVGIMATVTAKRFRDSGYSPWHTLWVLFPIFGPTYILIVCGFCPAEEE